MLDAAFGSALGPLLIFLLRIVDVSCDTMRVLFAIRGKRGVAGALGFVQALVWIFAVGAAVKHLDSLWHVLGYAAGYASGTMVGITIERAVAYGLSTVRIISRSGGAQLAQAMRDRGYGVTEFSASGREGPVEVLYSVLQRAHLEEVMAMVDRFHPDAFVTVEEPKYVRQGMMRSREWKVPFQLPGMWARIGGRDSR